MAQVDFGPIGAVDFPDEWTDEQLDAHIKQNGAAIRKDLIAKNQELNRQEAEQSAGPDTIPEAVGSAVGSMAQGAANTIGSTLRVGGRLVNLGAGYYEPAGADTDPRLQSIEADLSAAGGESPVDRLHRINSGPIVQAGNRIEDKVASSVPTLPESRDSFWFGDVPQGIGNAGAMVGVGAFLGLTAGILSGFGAESDDAFQEELARQQKDGETPDVNKAMAKSLGYGTAAAAIEAKLGAGRIIRKLRASFGGKTAEETALNAVRNGISGSWLGHMLKNSVKEGVAGYSEEALQRLSEDLIVHGKPDLEGMQREGAAGGVVQAILGIPGSHLEYRKHGPNNARRLMAEGVSTQAEDADMPKTANVVADMENATEQLYNPDLQMEDVADVVATAAPGQSITQAQTDAVFLAAEQARQAAVQAEQDKNALPTEPIATEGTGTTSAEAGAVATVSEPTATTTNEQPTEPTTTEPTVNPEPGVGESNSQSVVPVPATTPDNGTESIPVVEPSTTPETITGTQDEAQLGSAEPSGVASSEAVAPEPSTPLAVPESTPVPTVTEVKVVPKESPKAKAFEVNATEKQKQATPPMAPKAQKAYLLSEVDKAIAESPNEGTPETTRSRTAQEIRNNVDSPGTSETYASNVSKFGTVTISVPGDGTFTILNTKPALKAFKERAKKFPTTAPSAPNKPTNTRTTPSSIAPVGKQTKDSINKAASKFVSDEADRPVISGVWSDGKQTVATNGRFMLIVDEGVGGSKANPQLLTPEGKKPTRYDQRGNVLNQVEGKEFPAWQQVLPEKSSLFTVADKVDTARLILVVRQAEQGVEGNVNHIRMYRNPDGTIGVEVKGPDEIDKKKSPEGAVAAYKHNLQDGRKLIGYFNPDYVGKSLEALRSLGNEKVKLESVDETNGALVISGKGARVVLMGMNSDKIGGESKMTKQDKVEQDKILAALDKAIEATSTKGKVFDVVNGVSHVVANIILKAVRAAYVGGKALTAAIRDAIAEHKKSNPNDVFDEEGLTDWLSNQALGSTANPESRVEPSITMDGERQQSEAVSWLKDPEYSYRKETEKGRLEAANKIIEIYGDDLQGALNFVRRAGEGSGLTASIAEVTAAQIANKAQEKAFAAKNVIDRRAAEALRDAAIVTAKGGLSSQGQGLQAGKQVGEVLGAGAAVAQYQQMVQTKLDKFFKNKFPGVVSTKIKDWLHTAGQQAVQEMKDAMAQADNVVARVMKQARADYGTTWSEIMQDSAKAQDGHRKEIFRRILSHPKLQGLSRAEALEIANLLGKAWEKQRLAIFRREFSKVIKLPNVAEADMVKLKASIPKFIQQINLGLWDNEAFRNAIAPQFGQNPVSEDASRSIYKAAQEAQDAPEGPQRQTKIRRVAQLIAKESGVPIGEIIRGWWYASVLSGIGTQGRNFLGNTSQLVDNFVAFSVRQPDAIPRLISGLLRGMAQNASGEFGSILLRGQEASGRMAEDIREPGSAAETLAQDKRLWAKVFSDSKYVGRLMIAVDSFFYASNAEMMANFMAFRKGKLEGASTREEMNQYISEALKVDPNSKEWMDAQSQAEKEAAAGLLADKHQGTINRRRIQILNELRPLDIQQDTHRYALEATLNNDPEGVLGAVAHSLIQLRNKYPALTPIIPFVRISANVTNMLLDHSPAGVVKLLLARPEGFQLPIVGDAIRYPNRRLTEEQFKQLTAKVVISSIVMIGLAIKAGMDLDDDNPDLQITGGMSSLTPAKRKQLEEEGIRPYQIRIGGVGFDYRQTPGALMLSMLGSWLDGVRYSKFDEKEESVKFAALMAAGHGVIVDQSFLSGLQGILDRGPNAGSGDKWSRSLANAIGGFIPRAAKDIDRMVNPTVAQAKGFWDNLLKETPVARWSLATQKNILGEDIQRPAYPWSWAGSANNTDPVWKALNDKAQQGVFLPAVSASARVLQNGTRVKMTDDQFERYQVETGKQYRKALEKDLGRIEQMTPQEFDQWIKTTLTPIRERVRSQIR